MCMCLIYRPAQPVECPECGRMFKNNKALNGHMRLHGGFDWTKRVSRERERDECIWCWSKEGMGGSECV